MIMREVDFECKDCGFRTHDPKIARDHIDAHEVIESLME